MSQMTYRIVCHPEFRNKAVCADDVPDVQRPKLVLENQDDLWAFGLGFVVGERQAGQSVSEY